MMRIDLSGKVALVTGGSRGIGAEVCRTLAQAGVDVWFTHTGRNQKTADGLVQEIQTAGRTAEARVVAAEDSAATNALVGEIAAVSGQLDILVTNVGLVEPTPAEDITDERWDHAIGINLTSAFYSMRAALGVMIPQQSGKIVLIGSSAAYNGGGGAIDYAAAKAGLEGMLLYLNRNYAKKGIVTNAVHPCMIATDLLRSRYAGEKMEEMAAQVPVGRLGQPIDIAALVAFLASPFGDYICGQSFLVDGGRTLGR